jgi:hypothetical protein
MGKAKKKFGNSKKEDEREIPCLQDVASHLSISAVLLLFSEALGL